MQNRDNIRFDSFFMGGFECADHINRSGERVNLIKESGHDLRVEEDYSNLANLGIKVVREGVCWSLSEKSPYIFNFKTIKRKLDTAEKLGIQIVWDLCHFGYPDGLYPTHPKFVDRYVSFCRAFTLFHRTYTKHQLYIVPINEISFLSWHSGEMRGTVPFAINSGFDIKYHLCKAAIQGIEVIRQTDAQVVVLLIEPLVKIHAASDEISQAELEVLNSHQYQAMDIISGKMCPELGGCAQLFDLVGFNYYHNNQWDHLDQTLVWPFEAERMTPLSQLLESASRRFNKPVLLAETGHYGSGRAHWLKEVSLECAEAIRRGVDLRGICIYPVIDRPDWDNLTHFHNSGIWDLDPQKNRIPHQEYIEIITECIQYFRQYENPDLTAETSANPSAEEKVQNKSSEKPWLYREN